MELVLLKEDSDEMEYIWGWLEAHPINEGLSDPSIALNENEQWQYIGTYKNDNKYVHEVRHRCHPKTQALELKTLKASFAMSNEDIQIERKLNNI